MNLAVYIGLLHSAEQTLADSFRQVSEGHPDEPDVYHLCRSLAQQCDTHVAALTPIVQRYGEQPQSEPERLHTEGLRSTREGPVGLLRDLQDLYMLATFVEITWTLIGQAGRAVRDRELMRVVSAAETDIATVAAWLRTRLKQAAPQALVA